MTFKLPRNKFAKCRLGGEVLTNAGLTRLWNFSNLLMCC